jgi:hypothetical protein
MSQQPVYFWQVALIIIGGGLVLHSLFSKEALLVGWGGKAVRVSQSVLGITLTMLALTRFIH